MQYIGMHAYNLVLYALRSGAREQVSGRHRV
jgi:hypothetical protein